MRLFLDPDRLDEFEVAIFLRESRTRHSLLTRHKMFEDPENANRHDAQAGPDTSTSQAEGAGTAGAGILVESDSEEDVNLRDIPQAPSNEGNEMDQQSDDSSDKQPPSKRRKGKEPSRVLDPDTEEDKKLGFTTNYESFNIYGWVLCLLVTRKGDRARTQATPSEPPRQALMEEWISTQTPGDVDEE